jgi:adenylosuccinate synthase
LYLASGFRVGYGESVMATTVLVGAQWGDEGKGKGIDVLDTLPQIKVCVAYKVGSRMYETVPNDIDVLERCTPVYQKFEGWQTPTKLAQDFDQLPKRARVYLQKLAQLSGAKLSLVSVGGPPGGDDISLIMALTNAQAASALRSHDPAP